MSERRVVVTGMGVVSPLGSTVKDYWNNLLNGVSGIGEVTRFPAKALGFATYIGGEVKGYSDDGIYNDPKMIRRMDTYIKYALHATKQAIADSGVTIQPTEDPVRYGVLVGSGIGGLSTLTREHAVMLEMGHRRVSPFMIPMQITNMGSGLIAIEYGYEGPNYSISTACASANHSFGEAMNIIKLGQADVMIAGGAEATIDPIGYAGFCNMRALSTHNEAPENASRPWDKDRDGFVMGEGAGVLILEEYEHAKKRGAKIYAEIIGFGMTCDAYHLTAPQTDGIGASKSMAMALSSGRLAPEDVDYINAHGTSTPVGDPMEVKAVKRTFGAHAKRLKISSTKSMTGHLLGAAGGVEAVATIMSLQEQKIHPTINLEHQDPECDLDFVPNTAIDGKVNVALSNSFGFGGHNATIAFKKI